MQHGRFSVLRNLSGKGLAAVLIWGASFIVTRLALKSFHPFGLVAIRLLAGTLLLGLVLRSRGGNPWPERSDRPICWFLGVVLGAHLLIQAFGLERTSAGSTGWIIGFIPIMIALGAHALGVQSLGRVGWLGILIGTGGILAVVLARLSDFQGAREGNLLQVASCVTWTIYTLAAAGPIARNGVLRITTFAMGVAAVITALAAVTTSILSGPVTAAAVAAMLFLGLICNGLAYYLWFAAVDEHGPARSGPLLYLEPVVATITGAIAGEQLVPNAIIGGLCVLAGVWLVSKGTTTRSRSK